jgi:hypothetical protein
VGEQARCKLLRNGSPCVSCSGKVVDPDGQSIPFTTDGNGEFSFALGKKGDYSVQALRDSATVKSVTVKALSAAAIDEKKAHSRARSSPQHYRNNDRGDYEQKKE